MKKPASEGYEAGFFAVSVVLCRTMIEADADIRWRQAYSSARLSRARVGWPLATLQSLHMGAEYGSPRWNSQQVAGQRAKARGVIASARCHPTNALPLARRHNGTLQDRAPPAVIGITWRSSTRT